MDAHRTRLLRQPHHGALDLLGRHDEVGELVDHHYDVGQVAVSFEGIEPPRGELLVVLLDVARTGVLAQRQPVLHFDAERIERIDRLARIGDDGLLLRLHFGQEMPFDLGIERKLDHFGVDHHELQLRRMLLVEQGGDNGVQSH